MFMFVEVKCIFIRIFESGVCLLVWGKMWGGWTGMDGELIGMSRVGKDRGEEASVLL